MRLNARWNSGEGCSIKRTLSLVDSVAVYSIINVRQRGSITRVHTHILSNGEIHPLNSETVAGLFMEKSLHNVGA